MVTLHIGEERRIETAATGAGHTSSGRGVEGGVLTVERSIRKGEIEIGFDPSREMLGREKMRLFVLPILAPALLKGGSLVFLWQTGKQVRMAGRDAFLYERFCYVRDELQERQAGVDVRCTLARLQDERGHVIAGHVEQALKSLCLFIRMHVDTLRISTYL